MTDQVFSTVDAEEMFESASKELVPAPINKLLKFHVAELERTEQIGKFKTNPDGSENPNFGKPQPVLIFKGWLEESAAKGQLYSTWITGFYRDGKPVYSFGPKSKFGKIAEALVGNVEDFQKLKAAEIIGLPFQCAIVNSNKEGGRQLLNIDKIMPPAEGQTRVTVDKSPELDPEDRGAEFDRAIEEAEAETAGVR